MAVPHAKPGEPVDVHPLGSALPSTQTVTLVKTDALEVIRLVVPAGKQIERHQVPGEVTMQCLEGKVDVEADGAGCQLAAGELIYLRGGQGHALRGVEDASLLLTILLKP
jgi:quercetin dioxygenase-like cupin family protein